MPAASDPGVGDTAPTLPLRLRPRGVRIASVGFMVALLVTLGAVIGRRVYDRQER